MTRTFDALLSRRDLMIRAGAAALGSAIPRWALAQSTIAGKEQLIVRSVRPQDLETPVGLLNTWITPNNLFYVRHHSYAAAVEANGWMLTVDGDVAQPLTLTLDDLKKMPKATVAVTLECAGNGRAFFDPPVAGIQWERGAVGTARFAGTRLADVLKRAVPKPGGQHVALNGADRPLGTQPDFIRSVPIDKASDPDTILAYEMNGEPLPMLHGFPLRAIVPGWEGAYSVKWLTQVQIIGQEYDGFFVKTAYRYPNRPVAPGASVDPQDMVPLRGLVVKSLINTPADGSSHRPGLIRVAGFAWAGEAAIARVDVSMNSGTSWEAARLGNEREKYAWRSFEHTFNVSSSGSYLFMSRATDDKGRSQPLVQMWNPSGYLWNVIDRVRINVA